MLRSPIRLSNIVELTVVDGCGRHSRRCSQTYALILQPTSSIVQGTDYDTVGAYENADAKRQLARGSVFSTNCPPGPVDR